MLLQSLSRFIPQPVENDFFSSFQSTDPLILSQCCYRCLQILHYLLQVNKTVVIEALDINKSDDINNNNEICISLVVIIVRILAGVERNMIWFPVLLRASEIFQVINFYFKIIYLFIYYLIIYYSYLFLIQNYLLNLFM